MEKERTADLKILYSKIDKLDIAIEEMQAGIMSSAEFINTRCNALENEVKEVQAEVINEQEAFSTKVDELIKEAQEYQDSDDDYSEAIKLLLSDDFKEQETNVIAKVKEIVFANKKKDNTVLYLKIAVGILLALQVLIIIKIF